MSELAINGGKPVFDGKPAMDYAPTWPIPFPEIEKDLISIYRSGKWSGTKTYEQKLMVDFAALQGVKYSAWMANGTVTLETALIALGIGPGDEVIVPAVSWLATAEAPIYVGATPVVVDIDRETFCIDPDRIEEAITPRTKAIIPVHLFSAVADMDRINAIAKKHNLFVIEDCAHAHGARQHGVGVGGLGDIGSFSFQLSKLMTAGEGGCCTTNDERLFDRVFRVSHIGNSRISKEAPEMGMICHQYRMTEFQAAIIDGQIAHVKELADWSRRSVARLMSLIKDTPGIVQQKSACPDDERAYYFFAMRLLLDHLKPGVTRAQILKAFQAEGVLLHEGWGHPIVDMAQWNVPEKLYVKRDTPVSNEIMYDAGVYALNNLMLVDEPVIDRIAEAIDKVMRYYAE
ncbi:MAG: DegT/DnrJ/EryC1/StrS family aminotransferase [Victivallaceae bacterium]|nr:DegT/DnrJ/EryC1/StrS family aminotransferase [Victivallaceae bacterium]